MSPQMLICIVRIFIQVQSFLELSLLFSLLDYLFHALFKYEYQ